MARPTDPFLKDRILEKARILMVEDGYAGFSMRKLGKEVNLTAAAIYWYFENKDALVHSLIADGMEQLFQQLSAAVILEPSPEKQVKKACEAYISFGFANPQYYEIMFQLHAAQMERYPVAAFRKARRNLELFSQLLQSGKDKGIFHVENPTLHANIVWTTLHGFVSLVLSQRIEIKWQIAELQKSVVNQVLDGIKVVQGAESRVQKV
jgi:AcrR family transcriptional regulator